MKKGLLFLAMLLIFFVGLGAKDTDSLQILFERGIADLSIGRFDRAQPAFEALCRKEPGNANFNYLLGICYTEQKLATPRSVACLELAEKYFSKHYKVNSFREKKVPVYVYYYLTLAYSQNGMCEKARQSRKHFLSYYNFFVEYDYFIEEINKWTDKCRLEKPENSLASAHKPASDTGTAVIEKFVSELHHAPISKRKVVLRHRYFAEVHAVWGVQVGAFRQYLPIGVFDDLKNVDAFLDKEGMVRYAIGNFALRKQAESLLEEVRAAGYTDAFIVNVAAEKKFTSEVLMVDNYSLKKRLKGEVELKVQIGVFRDSVPRDLAQKYLQVDDIEEYDQNGLTMMAVGSFSNYGAAAQYRDELLELGIPGAFIIAMNHGKKVRLKQALAYLRRHYDQGM